MVINTKTYLMQYVSENMKDSPVSELRLPDYDIDTDKVKGLIVHEDPTNTDDDYFTVPYFINSGYCVDSVSDVLDLGIYMTSAIKNEKAGKNDETSAITTHMPLLWHEISLFKNLKAVILAGHMSIKTFNFLAKWKTGKSLIPGNTLSRMRQKEYAFKGIRIIPSYKMIMNFVPESERGGAVCSDLKTMRTIIEQ